jgi:hypothetical protein
MLRIFLLALLTGSLWAQEKPADPPPADVDQALRERINLFFKYHMTGEFRKAEALVAEDTKDYFYDHNKPRYVTAEIKSIEYSEKFTRAKAIVVISQYIGIPGFPDNMITVPIPSLWKIEPDGKWYWWIPADQIGLTPFGKMRQLPTGAPLPLPPGATPNDTGVGQVKPSIQNLIADPQLLLKAIKLNKDNLELKVGESGDVVVHNGTPGPATIAIQSLPKGISAKLSKATIQDGEDSTITIEAVEGAQSGDLNLEIGPLVQVLTVKISVK